MVHHQGHKKTINNNIHIYSVLNIRILMIVKINIKKFKKWLSKLYDFKFGGLVWNVEIYIKLYFFSKFIT